MSALCTHMMQGTPYVFQGEELGMTNYPFRGISEVRDLESLNAWEHFVGNGTFTEKEMLELISLRGRDNARTPMQWDDSPNAGFTAGKPWIPVNPDYLQINVKEQRARKNSVFRFYQKLIALRKEHEILTTGRYEPLDLEAPDTFAYLRISENEKLLVLCNYRNYEANVTLPESLWKELQTKTVKLLLTNEDDATAPTLAQTITLRPYEAAVLGIAQGE